MLTYCRATIKALGEFKGCTSRMGKQTQPKGSMLRDANLAPTLVTSPNKLVLIMQAGLAEIRDINRSVGNAVSLSG